VGSRSPVWNAIEESMEWAINPGDIAITPISVLPIACSKRGDRRTSRFGDVLLLPLRNCIYGVIFTALDVPVTSNNWFPLRS
jgi:hypothetical protein